MRCLNPLSFINHFRASKIKGKASKAQNVSFLFERNPWQLWTLKEHFATSQLVCQKDRKIRFISFYWKKSYEPNKPSGWGRGTIKKTHLLIFAFFVAFQFREATKKYFLNGSAIMGGGRPCFFYFCCHLKIKIILLWTTCRYMDILR